MVSDILILENLRWDNMLLFPFFVTVLPSSLFHKRLLNKAKHSTLKLINQSLASVSLVASLSALIFFRALLSKIVNFEERG